MTVIKSFVKNGRIELAAPADWPEGCKVLIKPEPDSPIVMMTEEEQGDDPESVARWLAAFDALPPLQMTSQEEADWQAWRQKVKDYTIEAVRRQMQEGFP